LKKEIEAKIAAEKKAKEDEMQKIED